MEQLNTQIKINDIRLQNNNLKFEIKKNGTEGRDRTGTDKSLLVFETSASSPYWFSRPVGFYRKNARLKNNPGLRPLKAVIRKIRTVIISLLFQWRAN